MPCRSPAGAATVRNSTRQVSGGGSSARDGMIVSETRRAISGAGNAPHGTAVAFSRCVSRPPHGKKGSSNWKCPKIGRASGRERGCKYGWISVVELSIKKKNREIYE